MPKQKVYLIVSEEMDKQLNGYFHDPAYYEEANFLAVTSQGKHAFFAKDMHNKVDRRWHDWCNVFTEDEADEWMQKLNLLTLEKVSVDAVKFRFTYYDYGICKMPTKYLDSLAEAKAYAIVTFPDKEVKITQD